MRAYDKIGCKFNALRDSGILIYFPHGFGDWLHFLHIVPLFEPTNRYYITQFGDDTIALVDGCSIVTPLYMGTVSINCAYGGMFGNRNFGIDPRLLRGQEVEMNLPVSLYGACVENAITDFLFPPFIDTVGFAPFPYHTKARALLKIADLSVGAPTGPQRLAMVKPGLSAVSGKCIRDDRVKMYHS